MSIANEWIVFDTNIWIFGLRNQADQPACYQLLQSLSLLYVKTPYQIFLELQANLVPEELKRFFRLIHPCGSVVDSFYQAGDAAQDHSQAPGWRNRAGRRGVVLHLSVSHEIINLGKNSSMGNC
jgi:hypothetical protein